MLAFPALWRNHCTHAPGFRSRKVVSPFHALITWARQRVSYGHFCIVGKKQVLFFFLEFCP